MRSFTLLKFAMTMNDEGPTPRQVPAQVRRKGQKVNEVSTTHAAPAATAYSTDSRARVIERARTDERKAKAGAPLEPTSPEKEETLRGIAATEPGTSSRAQIAALTKACAAVGEVTCLEAQRFLDIRHPPARIEDMTKAGVVITRRWVRQFSERGAEHRTMSWRIATGAGA